MKELITGVSIVALALAIGLHQHDAEDQRVVSAELAATSTDEFSTKEYVDYVHFETVVNGQPPPFLVMPGTKYYYELKISTSTL